MLAKKNRLRSNKEIKKVFQRGRVLAGRCFLLKYLGNEEDNFRLTVSISPRIVARAVTRNRLKRIIKEYFRRQARDLPAMDVLLITRPALRKVGETDIRREIDWLIRQLRNK